MGRHDDVEGVAVITLTRKTDYALAALTHLASQAATLTSAREIAERLSLPVPALMNILNQLGHGGLVVSARGPSGGYRLAKRAEEITLADVVEAVDGPVRLTRCSPEKEDVASRRCDRQTGCTIREPLQKLDHIVRDVFRKVTLDQIVSNEVLVSVDVVANSQVSGTCDGS